MKNFANFRTLQPVISRNLNDICLRFCGNTLIGVGMTIAVISTFLRRIPALPRQENQQDSPIRPAADRRLQIFIGTVSCCSKDSAAQSTLWLALSLYIVMWRSCICDCSSAHQTHSSTLARTFEYARFTCF